MKLNNITIIINPASGKNEPILNPINDVFYKTGINWDVKITKKFGDAEYFTKNAIARKTDLIVGYGGDGTQHELANGILTSNNPATLMAILPGGTGNGFGTGLGIPHDLKEALEIIVKSDKVKKVDVMKVSAQEGAESEKGAKENKSTKESTFESNETTKDISENPTRSKTSQGNIRYGISRMYTGIEEDQQTSRDMKNKYGLFAYAVSTWDIIKKDKPIRYNIKIDGRVVEEDCIKCYIANSGSTGVKISLGKFDVTDGLLDIFTVGSLESVVGATDRLLRLPTKEANLHYWKGKRITLTPVIPQAVWIDGEYNGRTPVEVEVMPGALNILVP